LEKCGFVFGQKRIWRHNGVFPNSGSWLCSVAIRDTIREERAASLSRRRGDIACENRMLFSFESGEMYRVSLFLFLSLFLGNHQLKNKQRPAALRRGRHLSRAAISAVENSPHSPCVITRFRSIGTLAGRSLGYKLWLVFLFVTSPRERIRIGRCRID